MNIEHIKGNNYTPKKTSKSDSSSKASYPEKAHAESHKSGDAKKAARLTLSGSTFDSEITFTKKILSNTRQDALDSLKKVKQKISAGTYNNENVHKEISSLVSNDLSTLQRTLSQPSDKKSSSPASITNDHKKQLLENPEVTKKVADNIANDLRRL